jgi:glycerol-3-phosphate dehydrogenase (NAD(P)+)
MGHLDMSSLTSDNRGLVCAVIGAGAWGTTLALLLGRQGCQVRLWARRPEMVRQIQQTGENQRYLPGIRLPDSVAAHHSLGATLEGTGAVVIAVPSVGLRQVAAQMAAYLPDQALVICATKGMERGSGKRMSQVLVEELPACHARSLLALSGPNLSREIADGLPAVSVVAGADLAAAEKAQALLSSDLFRVYTNCDIIGVELGGALKNVIAVGAGISDGLGYGDNAKASLITRGLAEMCRFSRALGALPETLWGIAGVGDLIATCDSKLSRNWTLGYRVGQGEPVGDVLASMHDVAEGYYTTHAARQKAGEVSVETPIIQAVAEILYEQGAPAEVARRLMVRRHRNEHEDWHGGVAGNT